MTNNAVALQQMLQDADRRDKLDDIYDQIRHYYNNYIIESVSSAGNKRYSFSRFPGMLPKKVRKKPELERNAISSKAFRCYATRRCLLCNKKVYATPYEFHLHALTENHKKNYLELDARWDKYNEYQKIKEHLDKYAATKGVYIAHRTEVLKDFIQILSTVITSHTPWILQEAGQLFTSNLYRVDSKQDRRQHFVRIINRIYKKEVLALMLLAYVKCEVTCNGLLTMHEVRVPDSKFGSSKPFRNLFTGLTITSGHIIVTRLAPFVTEICDTRLFTTY